MFLGCFIQFGLFFLFFVVFLLLRYGRSTSRSEKFYLRLENIDFFRVCALACVQLIRLRLSWLLFFLHMCHFFYAYFIPIFCLFLFFIAVIYYFILSLSNAHAMHGKSRWARALRVCRWAIGLSTSIFPLLSIISGCFCLFQAVPSCTIIWSYGVMCMIHAHIWQGFNSNNKKHFASNWRVCLNYKWSDCKWKKKKNTIKHDSKHRNNGRIRIKINVTSMFVVIWVQFYNCCFQLCALYYTSKLGGTEISCAASENNEDNIHLVNEHVGNILQYF